MKQGPTEDKSRALGGVCPGTQAQAFSVVYQGSLRVVMAHSRGPRARGGVESRISAHSSPNGGTEPEWGQSGRHTHLAGQPRPAPS